MEKNINRVVCRPLTWSLAGFLWFCSFSATDSTAAQQPSPGPTPGNRYLVIVETSKAMKGRLEGVVQVAQDLIASGMDGQLQQGDTLGVWTFNDDLHTGQFPLQTLGPKTQKEVGAKLTQFLQFQKYEKKANLEKLLPTMARVIQGSGIITVVIISTGDSSLVGTPFDTQINTAYQTWRKQQQDAHMPLVTVLRAEHGRTTQYSVNPAPWKVELPALPKAIVEVAQAKNTNAPTAKPVPSLIVSGRKRGPDPISKPPTPTPATHEPASFVEFATNGTSTIRPLATASGTNTQHDPAPAKSNSDLYSNLVQPASTPQSPSQVQSTPANLSASATLPQPQVSKAPSSGLDPKQTNDLVRVSHQPSPAALASSSRPAPEPESKAGASVVVAVQSTPLDPDPAPAVVPPLLADGTPGPGFFSSKLVWGASAVLVIAAFAFGFAWRSRPRSTGPISLITHSMDRKPH